jgi:2-C-methyl-D-erythritol 4-phosphate cytidylyltransferase
VIIPAGGRGTRLGSAVPKQYLKIGRETILSQSLRAFQQHAGICEIVLVVPPGEETRTRKVLGKDVLSKVCAIVAGGDTRQESVWNGLCVLTRRPNLILVHDAVRPFISFRVIEQVIADASRYGAAVVGLRVKDTIKVEGRRGFYARTLPRESLWAVQTPQGFRRSLLLRAHRRAQRDGFVGTDEASLVERLGKSVKIVEGEEKNIKITTQFDLNLGRFLARATTL